MDVVGLISSCIAIAELAAKSVKHLRSLQQTLKNSGLQLHMISTQLVAVSAAATHIQTWLDTRSVDTCMTDELAGDLQFSLDSCSLMLQVFSEQIAELDGGSTWTDSLKFAWNETDLTQYRDMLRDQVQALSLLLQVVKLPTAFEQTSLLTAAESQEMLNKARDDSTSLILLCDTDTCRTIKSVQDDDKGDRLSLSFDFDTDVFQSRAYQTVLAPYVKKKLLEERAAAKVNPENIVPESNTDPILALLDYAWNGVPDKPMIACGLHQTSHSI